MGSIQMLSLENRQAYGTTVLDIRDGERRDLSVLLHQLPDDVGVVKTNLVDERQGGEPKVFLTAACPVLESLELPCGTEVDPATVQITSPFHRYLSDGASAATVTASSLLSAPAFAQEPGAQPEGTVKILLVSRSRQNLDVDALQEIFTQKLPGAVVSEHSSWAESGADVQLDASWVMLLGAIGLGGLFIALALTVVADHRALSTTLAPIGSVTSSRSLSAGAAAWATAVPLLTAGVLGVLVYRAASLGMELAYGAADAYMWQARPAFIRGGLLITAATALLAGLLAARVAAGLVRSWRPGGQRE
ncbi:Uncharacterised protein [Actinomyces bovis]|uniref:FtsX-like permease family n=1 Tax=Actinomyces bovis TaxID=1658 RepID=A0ABY1VN82_9ACTO|nr:hypothetical protein [Actinomyces bovis]SPT53554.1 Uncharacterised protein [Actinomyces bovis]VEG55529.1 Uncharacterised protein [Actinomyces israelii]